ncbi:MAG: hypothetical protein IKT58_02785 [Oscillospiraceae bacterium]|nr:hypothetical protein [Oscillospiraceae bacterium]
MKQKRFLMILSVLLCGVLCMSCGKDAQQQETETVTETQGLPTSVAGLPVYSELSDTDYEFYDYQFSPVVSAVYRCGDTEMEIDRKDPRLLRLLNYLAYSEHRFQSSWSSDYLSREALLEYYNGTEPMLEVVFNNEGAPEWDKLASSCRIVICGDSFLAFYGNWESWDMQGETLPGKLSHPYDKVLADQGSDTPGMDLLPLAGFEE